MSKAAAESPTENGQAIIDDPTKCPKCGGDLVERKGRLGKFMGCNNFPKCKGGRPLKTDRLTSDQQKEAFALLNATFIFIDKCGGVTKAFQWLKIAETTIDSTTSHTPDDQDSNGN